jgi:hypothetical protein
MKSHLAFLPLLIPCLVLSEPIVLTGKMVPSLLGKDISHLRVTNHAGACIPFQIDEVQDEDYVCPNGKDPTRGRGFLDTADEIVFLWEDADTVAPVTARGLRTEIPKVNSRVCIAIGHGLENRYAYVVDSASIPLSPVSYIAYDSAREVVTTPYFYAGFGHDRFHFTRAGIRDFAHDTYVNVTNELRIRIFLKALWGLLPITYTENNMICLVKRYKVGPIRLIRRGDFHLNLGLFLQGSHAAVNQICYPQMVRVPVYVHLPVRFRTMFSEAYIEMTPVIRSEAADFSFRVPSAGLDFPMSSHRNLDTLVASNPNHTCMTLCNGFLGYGWLLDAAMDESMLAGSGYCVTMPSERGGIAQCGFRLTVRDLPKGYYLIGNWVLFSKNGADGLSEACDRLSTMAAVTTQDGAGRYWNQLNKVFAFRKR